MNHQHWMQQALGLAASVINITAPNPRVGCVIVRDGQLLAGGATQQAGGPHAEVMALRQAAERGVDVRGSTIYVSLEPCSHHGRTPPCVDALVAARPACVVVAMPDPNPLVAGSGLARLREAGIQVLLGVCREQALELNPGFVSRMVRKRPWVWLKVAASLDGRIALPDGTSKWITSPQARADGQHWRARSCVVLTGSGTVLADDPLLNVRDVDTPRQPVRAVVDTRFDMPENARLFDGGPVWLFSCRADAQKTARLAARNVQVVGTPSDNGRVSLPHVFSWMHEQQVNEVHVEAGARLGGALMQAGLVDELLVYMAPVLLGEGIGMLRLSHLQSLADAPRFEFFDQAAVGPDVRLRARNPASWQQLQQAVAASF